MIITRLRFFLASLLTFGLAATVADLLLLRHHESATQILPLAMAGAALAALVWHRLRPGPLSTRALQGAMGLLLLTGLAGMVLHNRGSAEFQREIDPSQGGLRLAWKAMQAKTPPALAPGILVQLGLLGLIYAYRTDQDPV